MIHVTFRFDVTAYTREVQIVQCPAIGETVHVDNHVGKVRSVYWDITSGLPNGRSASVLIEEVVR